VLRGDLGATAFTDDERAADAATIGSYVHAVVQQEYRHELTEAAGPAQPTEIADQLLWAAVYAKNTAIQEHHGHTPGQCKRRLWLCNQSRIELHVLGLP
jgi:hypothetical protein